MVDNLDQSRSRPNSITFLGMQKVSKRKMGKFLPKRYCWHSAEFEDLKYFLDYIWESRVATDNQRSWVTFAEQFESTRELAYLLSDRI